MLAAAGFWTAAYCATPAQTARLLAIGRVLDCAATRTLSAPVWSFPETHWPTAGTRGGLLASATSSGRMGRCETIGSFRVLYWCGSSVGGDRWGRGCIREVSRGYR